MNQYQSVSAFICPSVSSLCPSTCLSVTVCMCVRLSVRLSPCMPVRPSVCPSVCLSSAFNWEVLSLRYSLKEQSFYQSARPRYFMSRPRLFFRHLTLVLHAVGERIGINFQIETPMHECALIVHKDTLLMVTSHKWYSVRRTSLRSLESLVFCWWSSHRLRQSDLDFCQRPGGVVAKVADHNGCKTIATIERGILGSILVWTEWSLSVSFGVSWCQGTVVHSISVWLEWLVIDLCTGIQYLYLWYSSLAIRGTISTKLCTRTNSYSAAYFQCILNHNAA